MFAIWPLKSPIVLLSAAAASVMSPGFDGCVRWDSTVYKIFLPVESRIVHFADRVAVPLPSVSKR